MDIACEVVFYVSLVLAVRNSVRVKLENQWKQKGKKGKSGNLLERFSIGTYRALEAMWLGIERLITGQTTPRPPPPRAGECAPD